MINERDKMLAGELYDAMDTDLVAEREQARALCQRLNTLAPDAETQRSGLLAQLFGQAVDAQIMPGFHCDYGRNIRLGNGVFFNFNCVVLDVAPVIIGDRVQIGPATQIYTATHPLDAATRRAGLEYGKPVTLDADVWIGGGAIICPGVRVGEGTVVAAGSVVVRDVPAGVLVAGNPARIIREL